MSESLIGIFCTYPVSPETISSILNKAYQKSAQLLSPPSLLVLRNTDKDVLHNYTTDSVTLPPIDSVTPAFIGWNSSDIARFLHPSATGTVINNRLFLVADETTVKDGESLLLVQADYSQQNMPLESVRLSAECVNAVPVAVSVGSSDVREVQSIAHSDGVFRYGAPPIQGGIAPRKQL